MAMTEKQQLFAETYLANGFNALEAYYTVFGEQEEPTKNKPSYPYKLLKNKSVAEYIEKRRAEIYESLNIDATRVMQEIADIAFEPKTEKNIASKLKALDLLSKNLSLQTQKVESKEVIEVSLED